MGGRVAGEVAFVTGAARGIGRACALRLAEEGADVALLDIGRAVETVAYGPTRAGQLEETAHEIEKLGRRARTFTVDVRDGPAMRAAAEMTVKEFERIDIVVASAGIDSWADAWELTDAQWDAMIGVNLTGVWQTAKAVAPHMIRQRSGSMVFIGSALSHRANQKFAHYTAAKHGVLGLTRAFALELAPYMVRVNEVDPTAVYTDMINSQEYKDGEMGHAGATEEEVVERYLAVEHDARPVDRCDRRGKCRPLPGIERGPLHHRPAAARRPGGDAQMTGFKPDRAPSAGLPSITDGSPAGPRFTDRIGVVTGAGNGIGRAVALRLVSEGAHVVVADVDVAAARQTASLCRPLGRATALRLDVRSAASVSRTRSAGRATVRARRCARQQRRDRDPGWSRRH